MRGKLKSNKDRKDKGAAILLLTLVLVLTGGILLAAEAQVTRTTMSVDRITCGACLRVIDAELRKVPGILGMTSDLPTRRVIVDHDQKITPSEVAAAITGAGYPALVLESRQLTRNEVRLFQRGPGFCSGPGGCNPGGTNPVADAWRELCRRLKGEKGCEMRPRSTL